MTEVLTGVVETTPTEKIAKIKIKPIGWGWLKKFQTAQLNLMRISQQTTDMLEADQAAYDTYMVSRDAGVLRVQELLCKVIAYVPESLIVDPTEGGFDPTNPESLDNVDQEAVQALMLDLQKRLTAQAQNEVNAKN